MNTPVRLPDFFIIGFPKCGTTDLASLLDKHPEIGISKPKEPAFFNRDELHVLHSEKFLEPADPLWQTLDWRSNLDAILHQYSRLFEDVPDGALCGEASTSYSISRKAPGRIRELNPHAKLIVMLREPAKRLVSNYWFMVQLSRTCVKPDAYFYTRHAIFALRWGLYAESLKHWLSFFPRDQFHVVLFDEYTSPHTRQEVVDGICRFLGTETTIDAASLQMFTNKTGIPRSLSLELFLNAVRLRYQLPALHPFDTRHPYGRKRRMINAIVQGITRWNISYQRRPPAWPPEMMERLQAYYRHENAELSELIGRDVDAIWYGRKEEERAASPDQQLAVR